MAINKKAIIDAVFLATGIAAKNPIPPSMWSYNDAVKDDPYDPEAAKKLLAEAGYPNGLETDLWAMPVQRPYNPNAKRIAELMQADLAKIGVKAEIKSFEWGEYRKRAAGGRAPDRACSAGPATTAIRTTSCTPCSAATPPSRTARNIAKWCYKPFDDLVQKAKVTTNQRRAHQALRAGAGDLQGAGAVVHHRPCGAAEAGAQGSRRLQALARSAATRSTAWISRVSKPPSSTFGGAVISGRSAFSI